MDEKLNQYLNGVFAPYDGVKSVTELKADLLSDLQERFRELKAEGKDDETAFKMTIDSIGDIEQTVQEVANLSRSLERQLLINFSAGNLPGSDFAGVTAHNGKLLCNPSSPYPFVIKTLQPNYREFDDTRHFYSLQKLSIWNIGDRLWSTNNYPDLFKQWVAHRISKNKPFLFPTQYLKIFSLNLQ